MKNFKFYSLMALVVILASSLTSCKDDKDVTVYTADVYKAAIASTNVNSLYEVMDSTAVDKLKAAINTRINDVLKTTQKGDTVPVISTEFPKVVNHFKDVVGEVANNLAGGVAEIPAGKTVPVKINLENMAGIAVGMVADLALTNKGCTTEFTELPVAHVTTYSMVCPYVTTNVDDEVWLVNIDEIKLAVGDELEATWPKYDITMASAIQEYDNALPKQAEILKNYLDILPDTCMVNVGYSLVYNGAVIVKESVFTMTPKGVSQTK